VPGPEGRAASYVSSGLARWDAPPESQYHQLTMIPGYTGFIPGWTQTFGNGVRTLCGKRYLDSVEEARYLRKYNFGG
jgi:hypothetical protein